MPLRSKGGDQEDGALADSVHRLSDAGGESIRSSVRRFDMLAHYGAAYRGAKEGYIQGFCAPADEPKTARQAGDVGQLGPLEDWDDTCIGEFR